MSEVQYRMDNPIWRAGNDYLAAMEAAVLDQPSPSGTGADIAMLVQQDIEARAVKGEATYGERLLPNNGRDALIDAYQEALDLCMYLRQAIEERETT